MATYDATTAECLVYSYNAGSPATFAYDLKLRVTRFVLHVDDDLQRIEGEFDARSLRVDCAMKDGVERKVGLSSGDRQKIDVQVANHVLNATLHPRIRFFSVVAVRGDDGVSIRGVLQLNNRSRPVSTLARLVRSRYEADLVIHQPTFGLGPLTAILGGMRVKPEVLVRMIVPAPGAQSELDVRKSLPTLRPPASGRTLRPDGR